MEENIIEEHESWRVIELTCRRYGTKHKHFQIKDDNGEWKFVEEPV